MILYLDTSALVKRYVREAGTTEVLRLIERAETAGSAVLAEVEMAAALAKAVRLAWLDQEAAKNAFEKFLTDWGYFSRINLTAAILQRAGRFAWDFGLRGYDALHLSAAQAWQDGLEAPVTLATFDRGLWLAAQKAGMAAWPPGL